MKLAKKGFAGNKTRGTRSVRARPVGGIKAALMGIGVNQPSRSGELGTSKNNAAFCTVYVGSRQAL